MVELRRLARDASGDAAVEATILFPIMIMIFAALVMLAIYLPTRGALQRATQYAATAIATERSDAWLFFDDRNSMDYRWETDKSRLQNVYVALFSGMGDVQRRGEDIVREIEGRSISSRAGSLDVTCYVVNRIIYKEVVVIATRTFPVPLDLSLIRFPTQITVTTTSTAVVQNGDEFVRNVDLAVDFISYISEKFGLDGISDALSSFDGKLAKFMGWD